MTERRGRVGDELSPELTKGDIVDVTHVADLASLLRRIRNRQARQRGGAKLTYRELSAKTGWSTGTISAYLNGRTLPPTCRFDVLVELLDATPAERGWLATARDQVEEHRRRAPDRDPDRAPDLSGTTPVAAGAPVPRQLPRAVPGFVGRAVELAHLDALMSHPDTAPPVVVVSGTPGVGKTALAIHWAHHVADRFPDGQLYVDLRGFDPDGSAMNPATAIRGLLDAFGVAPSLVPVDLPAQVGLYRSLLAERRVLIVLDNARDSAQVRPLLPGSAGCVTLVTSRRRLAGLVAADGAQLLTVDLLPADDARRLLAARLGTGRVDAEPDVVADLISRCAHLPLALAVMAARAAAHPTFTLATFVGDLRAAQGGLDPFAGGDTSADVRAAFACSYRGLSPDAAILFRRLGSHPGPDVSAAAAASLAGVDITAVRAALSELSQAHMLTEHTPGRFTMHDLLRCYAAEQAHATDPDNDCATVRRRIVDHYLHTAHRCALLMYPHRDPIDLPPPVAGVTVPALPDTTAAQQWFTTETHVLRAVLEMAATEPVPVAWQLAWALADFLDWRGHWHELARAQRLALDAARRAGDHTGQGHAHRLLARADNRLRRHRDARTHLAAAVRHFGHANDHIGRAHSLVDLALACEGDGRHADALRHSQQALDLFVDAGHRAGQGRALNAAGWYFSLLGDHRQAEALCRRALVLLREIGNSIVEACTWDSLGYAQQHLGEHRKAARSYRRAIELYRGGGDRYHVADTLVHLGDNAHAAADSTQAGTAWRQALEILDELAHPAAAEVRDRLRLAPTGLLPNP